MKVVHIIAFILLIIGGLNWGLVGVADYDLVAALLGAGALAKVVYVLVGLAAIVEIVTHKGSCKMCVASGASSPASATL